MKETGFPEIEEHKREHDEFVRRVEEFRQKRWFFPKKKLPLEVGSFLGDWLTKHILDTDRKYRDHFLAHGIQ
ncbi:MAG: hypothetical protein MZV63_30710 [Marinilabiliales bacterium]|nr:hypothetical protein [Marinilabiliales bacterium]